MVKHYVKNAMIVSIMAVTLLVVGCSFTKQPITKPGPKEVVTWTGDKESIKKYLDSPYAQSDRYLIEALK